MENIVKPRYNRYIFLLLYIKMRRWTNWQPKQSKKPVRQYLTFVKVFLAVQVEAAAGLKYQRKNSMP